MHPKIVSIRCRGLALAAVITLVTAGCSDSSDYTYVAPAEVEEVGENLWKVVLTEQAATRTGLETTAVAMQPIGGEDRLTLPYSAVMYHFDGSTWTYTNPTPLSYLRAAIEIDYIEGDTAVLLDGPEPGTMVVSVGAAELYGVEFGIGK